MHDDFEKHGVSVIEKVRQEDPVAYLRTIVAVLPKDLEIALHVHNDMFAGARDWLECFRIARDFIGSEDEPLLIENRDE